MSRELWKEELTEEEVVTLTTKIAHEITKRRLEVPAILALEMQKPVANVTAHFALATIGFVAPFIGFDLFNDLTRLLAKRDNIERLLTEIEKQAAERDRSPKSLGEEMTS
ncbi:MAG: hypothetical protein J0L72_02625 [Armatimonadetes bacterium]|nr:hypothetical protein [Armatimonadota bacterium]